MRGTLRTGVAALAACLAATAAAHAHGPRVHNRTIPDGPRGSVVVHGDDPAFGLDAAQRERVFSLERGISARADEPFQTPPAWSCTERSTDDVAHARTTLPRYKVVYALPSDVTSKLALRAPVLQKAVDRVSRKFQQATGGLRGVRFDYGTACNPLELDITTVRLPRAKDEYVPASSWSTLVADVLRATDGAGLDRGVWDFVVLVEAEAHYTGLATVIEEDEGGADPDPARNPHARSGQLAVLYAGALDSPYGEAYSTYVATHEVTHTLGAVLDSAPNATGLLHCRDGYSIMCYADGGPNQTQSEVCTEGGNAGDVWPKTLERYWDMALDCQGDDFLSTAPSAGWLATGWNTFRHPALCPTAMCHASTIEPEARAGVAPGPRVAGTAVRFDASATTDRDGRIVRFEWDLDGDGAVDHVTDGPVLDVVPRRSGSVGGGRLTVVDDTGLTATTELPAVTVDGRPPAMALRTGAPGPSGAPVVLDATGSTDPDDGGRITRYRFTLPDGRVLDGTAPTATFVPPRPGRFEARVTGTDDEARSADAVVAFDVLNRAPAVRIATPSTRVTAGSDVRLSARADDPDGRVQRVAWDLDGDDEAERTGAAITTTFGRTGRRVVEVTATDDLGATATARVALRVLASPLRSVSRSSTGRIVTRVRCTGTRACRYRVTAGTVRRDVSVPRGATRTVTLRLPARLRRRAVSLSVRDRTTGRRLVLRRLTAPRR